MKQTFILPACFKKIGWCFLVPFGFAFVFISLALFDVAGFETFFDTEFFRTFNIKVFALLCDDDNFRFNFFQIIENNILDEIIDVGFLLSLFFISFSKERDEDECISFIRAESVIWTLKYQTIVLILGILLVYDGQFLAFAYYYLFVSLVMFVVKYHVSLYQFRKNSNNEQ